MTQTENTNITPESLTYEQAVARLEEIVRVLEQGDGKVPLETCMKMYEEGVALVHRLYTELQTAEQRVQILQRDADGQVISAPFTSTEEA